VLHLGLSSRKFYKLLYFLTDLVYDLPMTNDQALNTNLVEAARRLGLAASDLTDEFDEAAFNAVADLIFELWLNLNDAGNADDFEAFLDWMEQV